MNHKLIFLFALIFAAITKSTLSMENDVVDMTQLKLDIVEHCSKKCVIPGKDLAEACRYDCIEQETARAHWLLIRKYAATCKGLLFHEKFTFSSELNNRAQFEEARKTLIAQRVSLDDSKTRACISAKLWDHY